MIEKSCKILLFLCICFFIRPVSSHPFIATKYNNLFPFTQPDTIKSAVDQDSIRYDTTMPDTTIKKRSGLDAPTDYQARDSNVIHIPEKKVYLYGDAKVNYKEIELEAAFIRVDLDKNEVLAYGLRDTTDSIRGKPVFTEGEETFNADTIRYNFDTKKGIIKEVTTQHEGSYLHGGKTKKQPNDEIHLTDGKFTTCNLDHLHYYFKISKAKVIPNKKIVSGPAYLVVEDIPMPIGIPFGFFPNKKGSTSGVLIPEYGEEANRGFFLRNGGYYWAISDYLDLAFLGDIYSKGSWGAQLRTNYRLRYKMKGSLSFKYNVNKIGYEGFDNFEKNKLFKFQWKHQQDAKAHPNSNFSASVNLSSAAYDRYNSYSANNYMSSSKQSSINYSKNWPGTPFSMNASMLHSQNNNDSTISLTVPSLVVNMSRIFPLKRREKVGKTRWYEKIGLSYSMQTKNAIETRQDSLFYAGWDDFSNGIQHRIPITTSFKLFKHLNLQPRVNYTERWYFESVNKFWTDSLYAEGDSVVAGVAEQVNPGFNRVWDYNAGMSMNTKLYGMFRFGDGRLKAIRHVMTPSVGFNYLPDYGEEKYGYYGELEELRYNSVTGTYDTVPSVYSRFDGGIYGVPSRGGAGSVSFNLNNNLEMKMRNLEDTSKADKKVKLLESFNLNTRYNIMADSLHWQPLRVNGRTRIGPFNITFNGSFDPYAIHEDTVSGSVNRIDRFQIEDGKNLFRLTNAGVAVGMSFSAKKDGNGAKAQRANSLYGYPEDYVDFDVPWNLSLDYHLNYRKPYLEEYISQTLNFNGDVSLTKKWKISFSSGYDFENKEWSYTRITVHRDLHCWEMRFEVIPFGLHKSYNFQINVKSSLLQDLKLSKKRSWYDNF